jgi:hypothetical protein
MKYFVIGLLLGACTDHVLIGITTKHDEGFKYKSVDVRTPPFSLIGTPCDPKTDKPIWSTGDSLILVCAGLFEPIPTVKP